MQHAGAKRIIRNILTFTMSIIILTLIVFVISRLAPGDPLEAYFGDRAEKLNAEERAMAISRLGLDQPILVQYISWLKAAFTGDFGISYKYKMPATELIAGRIGNTLLLGGTGYLIIFAGALILGTICAWNEGRAADRLLRWIGTLVSCIPEFWMSLMLILVFAVILRILPSSGAYTAGSGGTAGIIDRLRHLILPLTAVAAGHLWYYAYMVRNKLCEELRADYVLMARAKGLTKSQIILRHCLRNVIPSYLSIMATAVSHILGGAYVTEMVFAYPGIGTLIYESARYKDYNLLMLLCMLTGILVIVCNAAAGLINAHIDPRLKAEPVEVSDEEDSP